MNVNTSTTDKNKLYLLRQEIRQVLDSETLKGKVRISCGDLPQQIQFFVKIDDASSLAGCRQPKLTFVFPHEYPLQPFQLTVSPSFFSIPNVVKKNSNAQTIQSILQSFCSQTQKNSIYTFLSTDYQAENKADFFEWDKVGGKGSSFRRFESTSTQLSRKEQKNTTDGSEQKVIKFEEVHENKAEKKNRVKPMSKNANIPKFLIRIFIKYLQKFQKQYAQEEFQSLSADCNKMKQWRTQDRKQHAFGLKHLKHFFAQECSSSYQSSKNRKVIFTILKKFVLEQICLNSQIPQSHRLGYLVACKVYALRCRNKYLASRIQSK